MSWKTVLRIAAFGAAMQISAPLAQSQECARSTCYFTLGGTTPNGSVGVAYQAVLNACCPDFAFTWSVSGNFPPGLTLVTDAYGYTGTIQGTPAAAGVFDFVITLYDNCCGSQDFPIRITIGSSCPGMSLSPSTLPQGTAGLPYSQPMQGSGGIPPYGYSLTGLLPTGLSLTGGALVGTPPSGGTYRIAITVTDARGCATGLAYNLSIRYRSDFLSGQGTGLPNPPLVKIHDPSGNATTIAFLAFQTGQWGVNVAAGEVDSATPSVEEIIVGPGPGPSLGPQVRGYTRVAVAIQGLSFYAYGTLKYGVGVGTGDLDRAWSDEIVTAPGPGSVFGPHVRAFRYVSGGLYALTKVSYFAYGTLRFGALAGTSDLDGDAMAEILTAPGPGPTFGPTVRGWNYDGTAVSLMKNVSFNAFAILQYGARVVGGDVDGDGYDEIIAAPGPGPSPSFPAHFRGFNHDGASVSQLPGYDVTPFASAYGGRPGLGDIAIDGSSDLLAGAGPDPTADSTVQCYSYDGTFLASLWISFSPFPGSAYGVNVVGARLAY